MTKTEWLRAGVSLALIFLAGFLLVVLIELILLEVS